MPMIPRVTTGTTAHTSTSWTATAFEQATDEEYEAWIETEDAFTWNASMTSPAEWSPHVWNNKDQPDFQLGDPGSVQNIKSYILFYGHPPPPASWGQMKAYSDDLSMAWIRPTNEHVRALDFGSADASLRFDIEVDGNTNRCRLLPSKDTINTDARFTAPGVLLTRARNGWLLCEGDLQCGLSVEQDTVKGDPIRNYNGLTQRLTGRNSRTGKHDVLEWGPNSGIGVYMPLKYTDGEGDLINAEAVNVRLSGAHASTISIWPVIFTPGSRLMSLQTTLEGYVRDGIIFTSTDTHASIPSESITFLHGNDRAFKLCKDTEVTVFMYQVGQEFKRELYYRDRKGVKDVDLTCRLICLAPNFSDLGLGARCEG